jgi:hypothetical protein
LEVGFYRNTIDAGMNRSAEQDATDQQKEANRLCALERTTRKTSGGQMAFAF